MRVLGLYLVIALCLLSLPAYAKNLSSRLGVGFVNEFSNSGSIGTVIRDVPAISAKYGLTKDINVAGVVGFHTLDPAAMTVGGKVFKNVFFENNLNFYLAGGAALVKREKTGLEILALLGSEFFIPGIDSLGLSFEAGVSLTNITGSFVLKTVGYTFLHAGMHFYF